MIKKRFLLKCFIILLLQTQTVKLDYCYEVKYNEHEVAMSSYIHSTNWDKQLTAEYFKNRDKSIISIQVSGEGFKSIDPKVFPPNQSYDQVAELMLSRNNIEEIPDKLFNEFRVLELLDVSVNRLKEIRNNTLSGLESLVELNFAHNLISNLASGAFDHLIKLETLILSDNCIQMLHNHQFYYNDVILSINLSQNQLKEIPPTIFDPFYITDEIFELDFSHNQLHTIPQIAARYISRLKVNDNQITMIVVNSSYPVVELEAQNNHIYAADLFYFDKIETLNLSNNALVTFMGIHNLATLEYLDVSSNNISDFLYSLKYSLENMKALHTISFRNTSIGSQDILNELKSNKLTDIDLSENNLTTINVNNFTGFPILEYINLNLNRLTEFGDYERMKEVLPKMTAIEMSHNNWDCEYFDKFIAYLDKKSILTATNPKDCLANGTRIEESIITPGSFAHQYTLQHVKDDLDVLKSSTRFTNMIVYYLFHSMYNQFDRMKNSTRTDAQQLKSVNHDVERIYGMITFITIVFALTLTALFAFIGYHVYTKYKLNSKIKIVTFNNNNSASRNEIVNCGAEI
uniref:Putative membrane glycoprotein lig-1 n=1 Tax=Corethrella appendiculata TaxID=1370023 RepID=U5EEH3_9DIPT